jgi:hypothetical protein
MLFEISTRKFKIQKIRSGYQVNGLSFKRGAS